MLRTTMTTHRMEPNLSLLDLIRDDVGDSDLRSPHMILKPLPEGSIVHENFGVSRTPNVNKFLRSFRIRKSDHLKEIEGRDLKLVPTEEVVAKIYLEGETFSVQQWQGGKLSYVLVSTPPK